MRCHVLGYLDTIHYQWVLFSGGWEAQPAAQPWAEPSEFGEVLPLPADTVAQAGDKALEVEFWPCLT